MNATKKPPKGGFPFHRQAWDRRTSSSARSRDKRMDTFLARANGRFDATSLIMPEECVKSPWWITARSAHEIDLRVRVEIPRNETRIRLDDAVEDAAVFQIHEDE